MYMMLVRFSAIFHAPVQVAHRLAIYYILAIQGDNQPHHSMHGGMVMLSTMGSVLVSSLAI